jgi:solute carrier family 35 protein F5
MAKIGAVATRYVVHIASRGTGRDTVRSSAGVILVSLSDSEDTPPVGATTSCTNIGSPSTSSSPDWTALYLGDCLALLSALFYAVYVILLKVRIRSESRIDMQLFFGFVGLFNIVACWPIGVILHYTGVERFELPTSGRVVGALLANVSFMSLVGHATSHKLVR